MVETVVPRNDDSYVLIVHGKHSKEVSHWSHVIESEIIHSRDVGHTQ